MAGGLGPLRGADHRPMPSTACGACGRALTCCHRPVFGQDEFGTATYSNAAECTSCVVTALPYDHRGLDLWAQARRAHSGQNAQSIQLSRPPRRRKKSLQMRNHGHKPQSRERETFWVSAAAAAPSRQGGHFYGHPVIQAASQPQSPLLRAQSIICPLPPGGMPQCGDVPVSKEQQQESPGAARAP